ncbi:MAG: magnesium transporter [Chloroherpetonaceae bacterium]|nr:magnesium transporter [Chthonomonadaceae bacterium]MDW8208386.1 magnesium transporter [Chloroherpetonaceae bacterium]
MRLENFDAIYRDVLHALGKGSRALDLNTLRSLLEHLHPSDIADILDELTLPEAVVVFGCLDEERAAQTLAEVSPETRRYIIDNVPRERIVRALDLLPMDDAAEIVAEVGEAEAAPLLEKLDFEDTHDIRELLAYPERTAGRLMTGKFASVQPHTTASLALQYLRQNAPGLETVNVVYVTNGAGRLLGVCSIRDLLSAPPNQPVGAFMTKDPVSVPPETDQKEVVRLISQYDLLAVPVVDNLGRILGIVTVDDVIDVLIEEFEEDIARLVGTDAEEMDRRTPAQVAKLRLPWLMGTMFIELCAGLVISRFDWVLREVILLASFMPVISAISGNVGLQAAAIVVRGLDTGHVTLAKWGRAVRKELTAGLLMAMACGLVLGTIGSLWSKHLPFGVVVGGAMTCSMLTAGFMGTVIPILSKRLGFDPATTAGPFETAFQDVVGFAVFLWLASLLIHWLK